MFEDGRLDARQAKLPEYLVRPTVRDIVPGSAHWIDSTALWVDDNHNIWVNDLVPLTYEDDDFVSQYARIIAFDEGLVIDVTNMRERDGNIKQFDILPFSDHVDDEDFDIGDYQPIIAIISTKGDLKKIKQLFQERYGIKLSGKTVKEAAEVPEEKIKDSKKKKVT